MTIGFLAGIRFGGPALPTLDRFQKLVDVGSEIFPDNHDSVPRGEGPYRFAQVLCGGR